jgi:hypothetical protein
MKRETGKISTADEKTCSNWADVTYFIGQMIYINVYICMKVPETKNSVKFASI